MVRTLRTRRLVQLAGIALAFALLLQVVYRRRTDTTTIDVVKQAFCSPAGTDSLYYMRLGEHAFQQYGQGLYRELFFTGHQKFIYPPSSLFLIQAVDAVPRTFCSPEHLWKALMIGGWLSAILLSVLLFRQQVGKEPPALELLSIALLGVLFLPFAEAFFRGQVQILLTALWGLSGLLYAKRKTGWAGAVLAVTCAFKPQLAIFLLWGVFRREWRFTAGLLSTGIVLGTASLIHFGLRAHVDYVAVLRFLSRHGEALLANQSVQGALDRLLRNGNASTWSYTVYPPYRTGIYVASTGFSLLCLLTGLLLPWLGGWSKSSLDFLMFGSLSVLMSPIAWEHHFGYFFLLLIVIMARVERLSTAAWLAVGAGFLGLANRLPLLDGFIAGPLSLLGDYMLLSAIVVLGTMATQAPALADVLTATLPEPNLFKAASNRREVALHRA